MVTEVLKSVCVYGVLGISSLAVTACGGGGGSDGSGDDDSGSASTTPGVGNVIPSLGAIENATINIYEADGETLLSTIDMEDSNSVSYDVSPYSDPVVVEVVGGDDATYYDEYDLTTHPFQSGEALYALISDPAGDITATILTDLAYQLADDHDLWPVTPRVANTLNTLVRDALAHELDSIVKPPVLFDTNTTSGSLGNKNAGRYAAKLAAFSHLADSMPRPSIGALNVLRNNYSDGDLSGSFGEAFFEFLLDNRLRVVADDFGTTALQNSIPDFGYVSARINQGIFDLGVDEEGATFRLMNNTWPAYDIHVNGPDGGYYTLTSSSGAGSSTIRFPDKPGRYECSDDANGVMIESKFSGQNPTFSTTGSGECEFIVLQAGDVVEGLASGVIVSQGWPDEPFSDGYFYVQVD